MRHSFLERRDFLATLSASTTLLAGCSDTISFVNGDGSQFEEGGKVNVEEHGIEGDGTTEVGNDVHQLLHTVAGVGGGIVYFPPGRYLFERTPLIGENTTIVGTGPSTVFEGVRPEGEEGGALLSNRGYREQEYSGASNWAVRNIRIDSPDSNGIMPAHAENVRLSRIYGDSVQYHHIDVVSSKNVTVDGYWATRGGDGSSDAPFQFDAQQDGISRNGIREEGTIRLAEDDGTPTKRCTLRNFEIDPVNGPRYGIQLHRGPHESITIRDGYISGCQWTAIRSDSDELVSDLTIDGVSCIENARGITLGHIESGRRELGVDNCTIRTENDELAAGSGVYAAGFEDAGISNVTVDGRFTNSVVFDDMTDLKMTNITATGAQNQAYRFRENVDATLTSSRASDCGAAGIYAGPGSSVTYGGITFEDVGREIVADGELTMWTG